MVLLFMAQLAGKMGKRTSDSMSIEEISTGIGRAPKTIRNVLVQLQRSNQIDRAIEVGIESPPKGSWSLSGL